MDYVDGHLVGTFQVMKPKIRKINVTHDVTFLCKLHNEFNKAYKSVFVPTSYERSDGKNCNESIFIDNGNNNNDCNVVSDIWRVREK